MACFAIFLSQDVEAKDWGGFVLAVCLGMKKNKAGL